MAGPPLGETGREKQNGDYPSSECPLFLIALLENSFSCQGQTVCLATFACLQRSEKKIDFILSSLVHRVPSPGHLARAKMGSFRVLQPDLRGKSHEKENTRKHFCMD